MSPAEPLLRRYRKSLIAVLIFIAYAIGLLLYNLDMRERLRQSERTVAAQRAQIELYVRWMQEVRHFQPSTVSRRVSVVVGFYRTCVIDQVLPQSPADYVRRPNVPPESPTLGLSHLQFEALLSAARTPVTSAS